MNLKHLLVWTLLLASVTLVHAQTDGLPRFEDDVCPFPEDTIDVRCGYLLVPEDRTDPDSPVIELAVAIIPSANGQPLPDPVIYLEGGPGGSALYAVQDFQQHPFRENRDLILLDQRGAGFSFPSLNCFEMEVETSESDPDPLAACRERLLGEGIDIDAYHSAANAADVNDLRIALGYDQVNLWGISYGTRLALTVLRDHPEGVRAVVLDSVYPPEIDATGSAVGATLEAFSRLFAACAEDPFCATAFPTLEADFLSMIERFNQDPPLLAYEDEDVTLHGDMVLDALFQAMYDSKVIPMLPYGLSLLADPRDDIDSLDGYDILLGYWTPESWVAGETSIVEDSVLDSDEVLAYLDAVGDISDSEGLYQSVECAEELVFNDLEAALEAIDDHAPIELRPWLSWSSEAPFADCDIWSVDARPALETMPVLSDVPALLVSGAFDPITPPSNAESAMRTLGNARHVVFPTGAHGETGAAGCGADIARAFFDAPHAPIDTSCVPEYVDWYVEDPAPAAGD